jgi:flagellar hook-length control protein FliK
MKRFISCCCPTSSSRLITADSAAANARVQAAEERAAAAEARAAAAEAEAAKWKKEAEKASRRAMMNLERINSPASPDGADLDELDHEAMAFRRASSYDVRRCMASGRLKTLCECQACKSNETPEQQAAREAAAIERQRLERQAEMTSMMREKHSPSVAEVAAAHRSRASSSAVPPPLDGASTRRPSRAAHELAALNHASNGGVGSPASRVSAAEVAAVMSQKRSSVSEMVAGAGHLSRPSTSSGAPRPLDGASARQPPRSAHSIAAVNVAGEGGDDGGDAASGSAAPAAATPSPTDGPWDGPKSN